MLIPNGRLLFLLTKRTFETNNGLFKHWNNRIFLLVKQPLAAIKITEADIDKYFLKKAKSKKLGKIQQN